MNHDRILLFRHLLLVGTHLCCLYTSLFAQDEKTSWQVGTPVLSAGPQGSFDETAVKDPSIVHVEGMWHVFYTARGQKQYTLGYTAAPELEGLQTAPRIQLSQLTDTQGYAAAPQVFFFAPQQQWYLIYQNREANYQPVFSTNRNLQYPQNWSAPQHLLAKDESAKWIDFWIIADDRSVYLFYTRSHQDVYMRSTSLDAFPHGWGQPQHMLEGVHEAVHIYRVTGQSVYHMIYELNTDGQRSFGLATASSLAGPWTKDGDSYAMASQLVYEGNQTTWTEEVSHGEVLRSGYDQLMEYEADDAIWLIQGLRKEQHQGPYPSLPWRLGLIQMK